MGARSEREAPPAEAGNRTEKQEPRKNTGPAGAPNATTGAPAPTRHRPHHPAPTGSAGRVTTATAGASLNRCGRVWYQPVSPSPPPSHPRHPPPPRSQIRTGRPITTPPRGAPCPKPRLKERKQKGAPQLGHPHHPPAAAPHPYLYHRHDRVGAHRDSRLVARPPAARRRIDGHAGGSTAQQPARTRRAGQPPRPPCPTRLVVKTHPTPTHHPPPTAGRARGSDARPPTRAGAADAAAPPPNNTPAPPPNTPTPPPNSTPPRPRHAPRRSPLPVPRRAHHEGTVGATTPRCPPPSRAPRPAPASSGGSCAAHCQRLMTRNWE